MDTALGILGCVLIVVFVSVGVWYAHRNGA